MASQTVTLRCEPCADYQQYAKRIESNGIYVTDIPPQASEDDLYQLFRRYGQIADFYVADSGLYSLVHFQDREAVYDVLNSCVQLYGRELRIRPRHSSKADDDKWMSINHCPYYHEEALKSIPQDKDFEQQATSFLKAVEADDSLPRKQREVCLDLEQSLNHLSQSYKIIPFGSSVSGLSLKDSDLDLFYGKEPLSKGPDIHDVFRKVKMVLEKHQRLEHLKPIPNARVPIIKFVHNPTGLSCDLSFRNTMGVQNSKLLKFLSSLDRRIKPFFIIVKYWAKLHHLTGKRMSNYALILLMINFLQSLKDPVLPPLCKLQHDGVVYEKVGDWYTGFDDSVSRLRPISNSLPLEELLSRFFESVTRTDFSNYVVCPYLGALIHKDAFYNLVKLPEGLKDYVYNVNKGRARIKVDSPLCIQDPIELNLNITKNVSSHDFKCLKDHCEVASKLSYTVPPHLFLSKLLSSSYKFPRNDRKSWLPNPMHTHAGSLKYNMTIDLPYPDNLTDDSKWMSELVKKLILIFRKVLKIHVETEKVGSKEQGVVQEIICEGSQVLWSEREKLWKQWHIETAQATIAVSGGSPDSEDDVKVLPLMGAGTSTGVGIKRKIKIFEGNKSKRRKPDPQESEKNNDNDVDLIVLDSDGVPQEPCLESRSLQDEITLTNDMVRRGHALPASEKILSFHCKICRLNNRAQLEISDRKSRNNYLPSLCTFLKEFLGKYYLEASDGKVSNR